MRRLEMLQPILPQVNVVLLEMLVQAETKEMKKNGQLLILPFVKSL